MLQRVSKRGINQGANRAEMQEQELREMLVWSGAAASGGKEDEHAPQCAEQAWNAANPVSRKRTS